MTTVLYYPTIEDDAILRLSESHPCPAVIIGTRGDRRVDLLVIDGEGKQHTRLNVAVTNGPAAGEPDYCSLTSRD